MIRFVLKKIKSKKWMSLCIVLGVALLVAVCSSHFIFKSGAENNIIERKFNDYISENNMFPGVVSRNYIYKNSTQIGEIRNSCVNYENKWLEYLELPKLDRQFSVTISVANLNKAGLRVSYIDNLLEHIEIVDGEMFTSDEHEGIISEATMDKLKLYVGDEITMTKKNSDEEYKFKVTGVFRKKSDIDEFWCDDISEFDRCIIVGEAAADSFLTYIEKMNSTVHFNTVLDYTKINQSNWRDEIEWNKEIAAQDNCYKTPIIEILESCKSDIDRISTLLYVLELPIVVLLVIFIYMISGNLVAKEEGEIAVLRSRGIKRRKIVGLYVVQSLVLSVFAGAIGLGLSLVLCRFAASTESFLKFTDKDVSQYVLTPMAGVGVVIGIVIAIIFMIIPVIARSGLTIVCQKSESGRKNKKPLWEKLFLDVFLVAIALYLFFNYNKQRDTISAGIINNKELDPLIFINSSLFIFAVGLLFIRIIGYLISLFFAIFKNSFKAWSFAAVINLKRTFRAQSFIAVFIILTLGNSIFNANLARSINEAANKRIEYDAGCDLRIREAFKSHKIEGEGSEKGSYYYEEPAYSKYLDAREKGLINNSTRVIIEDNASVTYNKEASSDTILLAINTKEFGEIAKLDRELTKEHWYNALNALSKTTDGVIVDSEFAKDNNLEIGSKLMYSVKEPDSTYSGRVYVNVIAIVDAFPGFSKYSYEMGAEEIVVEKKKSLLVVNYASHVSQLGVRPYEVWVDTSGKDKPVLEYVQDNSKIINYKSLAEMLSEQNSSAMIQITNGMFSINFIISIAVCITGFLVYWIMTIRSRELLFGVYRAMGVRSGEISKMLLLEQLICSIFAAGAGVVIGIITSKMFIKLISIAYLPHNHIVKVKLISDVLDMSIIGAGALAMFVVCMIIITRLVKSMKVSEALKLGED